MSIFLGCFQFMTPFFSDTRTSLFAIQDAWSDSVSVIGLFPSEYSLAVLIMCGCASKRFYDWPFAVHQISEHKNISKAVQSITKDRVVICLVFLNTRKILMCGARKHGNSLLKSPTIWQRGCSAYRRDYFQNQVE